MYQINFKPFNKYNQGGICPWYNQTSISAGPDYLQFNPSHQLIPPTYYVLQISFYILSLIIDITLYFFRIGSMLNKKGPDVSKLKLQLSLL